MRWKPRVIAAGAIVIVAMVLVSLGIDTYIQYIGLLAAGYLFGTAQAARK